MASILHKRQNFNGTDPNFGDGSSFDTNGFAGDGWWYSDAAFTVKWAIFAGVFVIMSFLFVGAYLHAQARMRKGLPPMRYHRFLVSRTQRARFDPSLHNEFSFYKAHNPGAIGLENMPPPVYDPNHIPPPTYQPPSGASKANPVQAYGQPGGSIPQQQMGVETPDLPQRTPRKPFLSRFLRPK